ncbi:MAG: prepilin-type N-terminal cleavage/methylation domain-containing protein [Planctomycetota bacterium]
MTKHKQGLTLIEMLAGLALTGLLVAALFQSLGVIVGSERRLAQVAPPETATPWREAVRRQVTSDLDQAIWAVFENGELQMEGWSGRDVETGSRHHEAVAVTYMIERETGFLIREQKTLGDARQRIPQRELVAAGAADIALDRRGEVQIDFLDDQVTPMTFNLAAPLGRRGAR